MSPRSRFAANDAGADIGEQLQQALVPSEPAVVLLGSQKRGAMIARVLRGLGVTKRVALITAGRQERESDDAALVSDLAAEGLVASNLRLHARSEEVLSLDKELSEAASARQVRLKLIQGFYRTRLEYTGSSARAISVRHVDQDVLEQESRVSVGQFRQLDADHVERCRKINAEFEERWRVHERPLVARNIRLLRGMLEDAEAIVIAGGNVASLLNRMKLFDVTSLSAGKHVVAFSGGAMTLTERIVLFHDFPPYGSGTAEVLADGLGLAPGLVVLPEPDRRLDKSDRGGIGRFAQRMAPAVSVALDDKAHVALQSRRVASASAERLTLAGDIDASWRVPAQRGADGAASP